MNERLRNNFEQFFVFDSRQIIEYLFKGNLFFFGVYEFLGIQDTHNLYQPFGSVLTFSIEDRIWNTRTILRET